MTGWWWALRRRWLEWRLARIMAAPGWRHQIVVLSPAPPCDHLDEVTMLDPFRSEGTITACAYCGLVLEQEGLL